jgi:pimeloyl-ACP methyl ester carboxylesterase
MKILKVIFTTILFLAIITFVYLVIIYKGSDKEKTELTNKERKGTAGQYIKLSQGITHYQLDGPDTGRVVIMVHGFSVPYFIWDGTYEFLVKQGFRVLRYDQYGRGYSDRPDVVYNQDLYQTQITDLISKLHLKTPVNIMGVSFGGEITTNFTCKHPGLVDKVILIDPGYSSETPSSPKILADYYEATHGDERASGQLADFKYPGRHPNWVNKYKPQMQYKGFRNALLSTLYNYNYKAREDNTCLNSVHKQVLLIWGREDHTVPFTYSDSVRSVLKVDFFPVDDAGHLPYIEQAGKVNAKIVDFLKR